MLLADQDRSLWDTAQIADGRAVLDRALALRGRGPYVVQAAIASLHADEPRDWPQIAALYGELARLTDSPVVELNRAVAVAEARVPRRGSAIVDRLALEDYRYLHSTRGELLRRLGRTDEARDAYRRALALVHDDAERRLLERRLAELGAVPRHRPAMSLRRRRGDGAGARPRPAPPAATVGRRGTPAPPPGARRRPAERREREVRGGGRADLCGRGRAVQLDEAELGQGTQCATRRHRGADCAHGRGERLAGAQGAVERRGRGAQLAVARQHVAGERRLGRAPGEVHGDAGQSAGQRRLVGCGGRVERHEVAVAGSHGRDALEREPRAQREAAEASRQMGASPARVRARDEDRLAGRHERGDHAGRAPAAPVADRGAGRRRTAVEVGHGRPLRRVELGQRGLEVVLGLAGQDDRRRVRRLGAAQHEPRLDRAVVLVELEAEGRVERPFGPSGSLAAPNATARARTPPASTVNRTCLPSPIGRGSASRAAGTSSETSGLPMPNGARRSSSSASAIPSSSPATTASTRSRGTRSSGLSTEAAWALNATRNASSASRCTVQPAAARWPP